MNNPIIEELMGDQGGVRQAIINAKGWQLQLHQYLQGVGFGSCVTSVAMSTGDAQLYER